ncbi:MAG: 4Fe-4S binding protein [Nitrospirae bacterium]|nr:4Fe-4S binding protein [Nitrospirota bacterium]
MSIDKQDAGYGTPNPEKKQRTGLPLSRLRRFVLLGIIVLFILQFVRVKILVGGLTGSLAVWFVTLIDIFAYADGLVSSRDFGMTALVSVLPVALIYLVFGRAFCGWVCPMDFLYELVGRMKNRSKKSELSSQRKGNISPKIGYGLAAAFLLISGLLEVPFFTNYLSHLTNFFRLLTGGVFFGMNLPVDRSVIIFSGSIIAGLLVLEFFFPRLWCRVFCPVGKTYGLFNKISLIRLSFAEGQCGECNLCDHMCYMKVKIARHIDETGLRDINCIYCGRCIDGCSTKGKLIKMRLWR